MSVVPVFVGMDVAKAQLDIALRPTGERWAVTNDETGITALVVQLQAMQPMLIVLEATGGYHRAVVAALAAAALPIVVVNPRQYETLRKRLGSWPKPMRSMPVLWLTLRRPCGPCRARCRMHRRQRCALFWRGGGN